MPSENPSSKPKFPFSPKEIGAYAAAVIALIAFVRTQLSPSVDLEDPRAVLLQTELTTAARPDLQKVDALVTQSDRTMQALAESLRPKLEAIDDPVVAQTLRLPFVYYEQNRTNNPERNAARIWVNAHNNGTVLWGTITDPDFFWIGPLNKPEKSESSADASLLSAFSPLERVLYINMECAPESVVCQLGEVHEVGHAIQDTLRRTTLTDEALANYLGFHINASTTPSIDLDKELGSYAYEIEYLNLLIGGDLKAFYTTGVPALDVPTVARRLNVPYAQQESLNVTFQLAQSYYAGGGWDMHKQTMPNAFVNAVAIIHADQGCNVNEWNARTGNYVPVQWTTGE